ncbi:antitoxin, XRE family [Geotalea daltonii FRC-32]|uniref:Antitoxin, XRE family n=1 Tax=Geotalea daltonii (strain DSM 22248 / JCM 15807 / FRC-32) TaxID=316067 RepID=B9M619_GEODF|nr:mobile mystery protein A [Geotalea daltonii]ACM20000.1 antitoxin, XRE family [Geotalea daltonii FRC-32]
MLPKYKLIARQQLDNTLSYYAALKQNSPPVKGWIRAIREALGMSGKQLAKRLNVSQPRIPKLERDELSGVVSIKTMRQAAEALDCVFVYAMIPRTTLEETVRAQARKVADARTQRVSHTMLLEAQNLSDQEQSASIDAAVDELVQEMPKELWESKP